MNNKNNITKKVYSKAANILVKSSKKIAVDSASVLVLFQPKIPKGLK